MSMSQCPCVSMSPSSYPYVSIHITPCPCLHVSGIRKTKLTESSNFQLFSANGKWKGKHPFNCCKENGRSFSLVGKQWTLIDVCCASKRAHPWFIHTYTRKHVMHFPLFIRSGFLAFLMDGKQRFSVDKGKNRNHFKPEIFSKKN